MALLNRLRRWQLARKAEALIAEGDAEGARAVLAQDADLTREVADSLLDRGMVGESRALLGHGGGSTLQALLEAPSVDVALEQLLARARTEELPDDTEVLSLARTLVNRERPKVARELLERAALERHSWNLLRPAIELGLELRAYERTWPLVEQAFALPRRRETMSAEESDFLRRAHEVVLGHLEGAEAVTVDLMLRREVDAFASGQHLVLARALMKQGPLTTRLTLVSAAQELREGEARLAVDRTDATGLFQVGSARLRLGELGPARAAFERGRDVAPRHFGLVAGLGAARAREAEGAVERVVRLPALSEPAELARVIPDVDVLTSLERKVVLASAVPFRAWLPALVEAGATLRILPLDVRATDLPGFDERRSRVEARTGRPWDARGGLAGEGLGDVRVEELLDLSARGWSVARELAHLVHAVLPAPLSARLEALRSHGDEVDGFPPGDGRELFAATTTRWLARKYDVEPRDDGDPLLLRSLAAVEAVIERG